jgi:hypothetical protein
MRHLKPLVLSILAGGLFSLLLLSSSLSSCKPKKCPPCDTAIKEKAPLAFLITNFYELSMTKNQYVNVLKNFHGANGRKIVVQFYFNNNTTNSPSLIAYSGKANNKFKKGGGTASVILTITAIQGLAAPNVFALGDQQVSFSDIDALIAGAGNPADYTLIFKPRLSGINIYYQICVKYKNNGHEIEYCGGDPGAGTQPSPPADCNP